MRVLDIKKQEHRGLWFTCLDQVVLLFALYKSEIIYTYIGFKGLMTSPYLKEFGDLLI